MKQMVCFLAIGLILLGVSPVAAATFTVNTNADAHDANTADGVCASSGGGCTLRAAVEQANALGGAQTIELSDLTYTLTLGHLSVTTAGAGVTISGAGFNMTYISGNDSSDVLVVGSGASVTLEMLEVVDGHNASTDGGCLTNYGTLELHGVGVSFCSTEYGGGGIYNSGGTLSLSTSAIAQCAANGSPGDGGGIFNLGGGTVVLQYVNFVGNTAEEGGGIYSNMSTTTTEDTWFHYNSATIFGGGAVIDGGTATITNGTFDGNSTDNTGGGMLVGGTTTLTNVTFSGNTASGPGGAITLDGLGALTMRNVTITGSSDDGTAAALYKGIATASTDVANTLIADNGSVNCDFALTSSGHNLEDHDTCGLGAPGDLVNTTPLLGALGNNWGLTETVALLPGSPGIDDGDDALAPTTDQRGVPRPQDGDGVDGAVSDIGAFEYVDLIFLDGFEIGGTYYWSSTAQ